VFALSVNPIQLDRRKISVFGLVVSVTVGGDPTIREFCWTLPLAPCWDQLLGPITATHVGAHCLGQSFVGPNAQMGSTLGSYCWGTRLKTRGPLGMASKC